MSWQSGSTAPEEGRGANLLRRLHTLFPDREVFLRADGRVRYISVSSQVQILAAGAVAALVLWSMVTTGVWLLHDRALASRDATIARQQHAFDALVDQVDAQRRAVAEVSNTLRRSQTLLQELLGPDQTVAAAPATADASVASQATASGDERDALRAERERALRRLGETLAEVNALGTDLSRNADVVQTELRDAINERTQIAAARRALQEKVAALETELASAAARAEVQERNRRELSAQVDKLAAESRTNARERDRYRRRARNLETQLATVVTESDTLQSKLHAANQRIDALGAQYAATTEERDGLRGKTQRLVGEVSQSTAAKKALQGDLNLAQAEIAALTSDKAAALRARDAQRQRGNELAAHLAAAKAHDGALQDDLDTTKQQLNALAVVNEATGRERDQFRSQGVELQKKLAAAVTQSKDLSRNLYAVTAQLDQVSEQAQRLAGERDTIREQYEDVQELLVETRERHQLAINRLLEATSSEISRSEKLLAMTGVDVDTLLTDNGVAPLAQGGPFVAPGPLDSTIDPLATGSALLDLHIDRWEGLQSVFRALPLTAPVDNSYITSGFGRRMDPITKRPAMHHGIDFAGRRKTPVMAAAPGVVTYAGPRGYYGKLVEIDHGFGVHTRYGHLSKVLVENGDHVSYREEIGLMGSTGRSTGPHLHYEILVDNRPVDPLKFLDVGRYLTKPLPRPRPASVIIPKPKPARSAS